MSVSVEEVLKLAKLSRIETTPEEAEALARDMQGVLEYVAAVNSAVLGVDANAGDSALVRNVLRQDGPAREAGTYTEAMLANAPSREGNYIAVKKVLEK